MPRTRHQNHRTRIRRAAGASLNFEVLEARLALSGTGLTGQYFHNGDFTGLADTRVEAIAKNWGVASPGSGIEVDTFSVRWTGQIQPRFSENYTITALSDEGVRIWVDGKLVVDDWASHTVRYTSGTIDLVADRLYDIRIDYREGAGLARMELYWASASQGFQFVPADRLYTSPSGLLGSYSDDFNHGFEQVDSAVNFNWGTGAPPTLSPNNFQVTWTGQIQADYSELYTFNTTSDDGARLWIGGELVIDDWNSPLSTSASGSKMLEAGKWYDIKVEYVENTGSASVALNWASAHQTVAGQFELVPASNLQAAKATALTFKNPLGGGRRPVRCAAQWTLLPRS